MKEKKKERRISRRAHRYTHSSSKGGKGKRIKRLYEGKRKKIMMMMKKKTDACVDR